MNARQKIDQRIQQLEKELKEERRKLVGEVEQAFSLAGVIAASASSGKDLVKLWGKKGGFKKWLSLVLKRLALGRLLKALQKVLAAYLK